MINELQLYFLTRLDSIDFILSLCIIMSLAISIVIGVGWVMEQIDENKQACGILKKYFKKSFITLLITILLSVLIPTSKEAAAIYVIPKIANTEVVQKLNDSVKVLAIEWIKELKPKQNIEAGND